MLSSSVREIIRKRVLIGWRWLLPRKLFEKGIVSYFCGMIWSCPILELLYLSPMYIQSYWGWIQPWELLYPCSAVSLLFPLSVQVNESRLLAVPQVFFCKTACQPVSPSIYWCMGLFLHRCTTSICWTSGGTCWAISPAGWCPAGWRDTQLVHQPHFPVFILCKLAEVCSASSSSSLMKMLSNTGHSINPGLLPQRLRSASCHWSQLLEPNSSAGFQCTSSLSTYLAYTWWVCLWGCYRGQCLRPC